MEDTSRIFIAVELDKLVKKKLNKVQNMLRDCSLNIKWVDEVKFHITLKFLGDITVEEIEEVKQGLKDIHHDLSSFEVVINGLGAFPNMEHPKVIWAGFSKNNKELINLHQAIENKMVALGFKEERHSYTPHVTLGRVRDREKNQELISDKIADFPFEINAEQVVDKISVVKSELTPQGPIYNSIAKFSL